MTQDAAHILVVDDDDRIRDLLKRYLTREGYRVTSASRAFLLDPCVAHKSKRICTSSVGVNH